MPIMRGVDDVLTVRRWQRYGADRLYVTHENGQPVGSVDLQSGEVAAEHPTFEPELRRAVQAYLRSDLPEMVLPTQGVGEPEVIVDRELQAAMESWLAPARMRSVRGPAPSASGSTGSPRRAGRPSTTSRSGGRAPAWSTS